MNSKAALSLITLLSLLTGAAYSNTGKADTQEHRITAGSTRNSFPFYTPDKEYVYKGTDDKGARCAIIIKSEEYRSSFSPLHVAKISAVISYGDPNAYGYPYTLMKHLKPGAMTDGTTTIYWNGSSSTMDNNTITKYEYSAGGETRTCVLTAKTSYAEFQEIRWPNGMPVDPNDPRL